MTESKGNSQTRAKNKYNSKNYDSLRIVVKKGKKAIISQYAQEQGKSINGLVNELLEDKIPQLKVLAFYYARKYTSKYIKKALKAKYAAYTDNKIEIIIFISKKYMLNRLLYGLAFLFM